MRASRLLVPVRWFWTGGWYFLVVGTFGLRAAIPVWHAAVRVRRRGLVLWALLYTVVDAGLIAVSSAAPRDATGEVVGARGEAMTTGYVVGALVVLVLACVHLRGVRREVWHLRPPTPGSADPVVARALAARARRQEAPEVVAVRAARGTCYAVDEVFFDVDLPPDAQAQLREHAVVWC